MTIDEFEFRLWQNASSECTRLCGYLPLAECFCSSKKQLALGPKDRRNAQGQDNEPTREAKTNAAAREAYKRKREDGRYRRRATLLSESSTEGVIEQSRTHVRPEKNEQEYDNG